jgi:hypothetical protein
VKPQLWLPVTVFLAVSIPLVLLLNLLQWMPEYRVWIALACGAAASAYTQHKLKQREGDPE